jgi:MoxR-like ATPase
LKQKISNLLKELNYGLIEREPHIKEALLTMLAGENLLLIGPPGTAKSEIARRLSSVVSDGKYFEYLLTKFSTPEELFGPMSVAGLKEDRFERKTDGYLPTSHIAFLDETFKANSSILNSLLTIMNEKIFRNGTKNEKTNLLSVIGASNELPKESIELQALYDRFLTRMFIDYVSEEKKVYLLLSENKSFDGVSIENRLKVEELESFHKDMNKVKLSQENAQIISNIHKELKEKFNENDFETISDRRLKKAVKILKASALSNERSEVNVLDISLLSNVFWNDEENRDEVEKVVLANLPTSDSKKASKMSFLYDKQFEKFQKLNISENMAQERNENGEPLFLNVNGERVSEKESEILEEVHLEHKTHGYIYFYGRENFQFSTQKADVHPQHHRFFLLYSEGNPVQNEKGEYIYFHGEQQFWNSSHDFFPQDHSYRKLTYELPFLYENQPIQTPLRNIVEDLEVLFRQTSSKLPEVEKGFGEIEQKLEEVKTSINSHLWIEKEKVSVVKNSLQNDFEEVIEVLAKFQKLKNTIELYYKKAVEDRENRKKSLEDG